MRRALVLGDDAARHPFRQQLPRHLRAGTAPIALRARPLPSRGERLRAWSDRLSDAAQDAGKRWLHAAAHRLRRTGRETKVTTLDVREFLLAYCACFIAAIAFLS